VVARISIELMTFRLWAGRSDRLSYLAKITAPLASRTGVTLLDIALPVKHMKVTQHSLAAVRLRYRMIPVGKGRGVELFARDRLPAPRARLVLAEPELAPLPPPAVAHAVEFTAGGVVGHLGVGPSCYRLIRTASSPVE
jgi:hypothetical protein